MNDIVLNAPADLAVPSASSALPAFRHDHVALRVADREAAARWYADHLGFTVTLRWAVGDLDLAYLERGDVRIELIGGGDVRPGRPPVAASLDATFAQAGVHHLCVAVDNVDAMVTALAARGVSPFGQPFDVPDIARTLAFVQDPFGNLIEFSGPIGA